MIYELRIYEPVAGKAEAMRHRFLTRAAPIIRETGLEIVAIFDVVNEPGKLAYMVRATDGDALAAASVAFRDDARWRAAKAESELDGALLASQTLISLVPIDGETVTL